MFQNDIEIIHTHVGVLGNVKKNLRLVLVDLFGNATSMPTEGALTWLQGLFFNQWGIIVFYGALTVSALSFENIKS